MGDSTDDRLTRIGRLLEGLTAQTSELHRLAVSADKPKGTPPKPAKRRVRRNR